jgi:hypothetical protein
MTFDRDCLMALWTAKSFYHFAQASWPLVWHQGGPLSSGNRRLLQKHFPDSYIITTAEADSRVEAELGRGGFRRSIEARRKSFSLIKMIDFVVLSRAGRILNLDSDILFFAKPEELLAAVASDAPANLFNRDNGSCYNLSPEAARRRHGVVLVEELNAGLGLVRRGSFSMEMIESFLEDPDVMANVWLADQTLQALGGRKTGVSFLPETYSVSKSPGLSTEDGRPLVAKHYPGPYRQLLFEEGMLQLIERGFFRDLSCRH